MVKLRIELLCQHSSFWKGGGLSFRNLAVAVSFRAFAQTVSFSLSLFDHHFFDTGDKD